MCWPSGKRRQARKVAFGRSTRVAVGGGARALALRWWWCHFIKCAVMLLGWFIWWLSRLGWCFAGHGGRRWHARADSRSTAGRGSGASRIYSLQARSTWRPRCDQVLGAALQRHATWPPASPERPACSSIEKLWSTTTEAAACQPTGTRRELAIKIGLCGFPRLRQRPTRPPSPSLSNGHSLSIICPNLSSAPSLPSSPSRVRHLCTFQALRFYLLP